MEQKPYHPKQPFPETSPSSFEYADPNFPTLGPDAHAGAGAEESVHAKTSHEIHLQPVRMLMEEILSGLPIEKARFDQTIAELAAVSTVQAPTYNAQTDKPDDRIQLDPWAIQNAESYTQTPGNYNLHYTTEDGTVRFMYHAAIPRIYPATFSLRAIKEQGSPGDVNRLRFRNYLGRLGLTRDDFYKMSEDPMKNGEKYRYLSINFNYRFHIAADPLQAWGYLDEKVIPREEDHKPYNPEVVKKLTQLEDAFMAKYKDDPLVDADDLMMPLKYSSEPLYPGDVTVHKTYKDMRKPEIDRDVFSCYRLDIYGDVDEQEVLNQHGKRVTSDDFIPLLAEIGNANGERIGVVVVKPEITSIPGQGDGVYRTHVGYRKEFYTKTQKVSESTDPATFFETKEAACSDLGMDAYREIYPILRYQDTGRTAKQYTENPEPLDTIRFLVLRQPTTTQEQALVVAVAHDSPFHPHTVFHPEDTMVFSYTGSLDEGLFEQELARSLDQNSTVAVWLKKHAGEEIHPGTISRRLLPFLLYGNGITTNGKVGALHIGDAPRVEHTHPTEWGRLREDLRLLSEISVGPVLSKASLKSSGMGYDEFLLLEKGLTTMVFGLEQDRRREIYSFLRDRIPSHSALICAINFPGTAKNVFTPNLGQHVRELNFINHDNTLQILEEVSKGEFDWFMHELRSQKLPACFTSPEEARRVTRGNVTAQAYEIDSRVGELVQTIIARKEAQENAIKQLFPFERKLFSWLFLRAVPKMQITQGSSLLIDKEAVENEALDRILLAAAKYNDFPSALGLLTFFFLRDKRLKRLKPEKQASLQMLIEKTAKYYPEG